jgi:multiple sugar transport system ATP-binding protein
MLPAADDRVAVVAIVPVKRCEKSSAAAERSSFQASASFAAKEGPMLHSPTRQRVAMGRAIVRQPQAFLMDEPLSNLDAKLRVQMRAEISGIQRNLKTTTIYVTHDQVEAMTMGDRVAVIRKGELQQVDSPQQLYDRPVNLFVGGFIGSPAMNLIEATLEESNGGLAVKAGEQVITLDDETLKDRPALKTYEGRQVVLGIRPEDLEDAELEGVTSERRIRARVELREALGSEILVHFTVQARPAVTDDVRELARDIGDESAVEAKAEDSHTTMVGRFSPRSQVRVGDVMEVAVDTRALHFFDPDTGVAIYKEQDSTKGAGT